MNDNRTVVVNYRPNEQEVSPNAYESLNNALDSIGGRPVLFLDARSTSLQDKARWERFFEEIQAGEAYPGEDEVVRENNPNYEFEGEPLESLCRILYERPEDVEKVDAGPVVDLELKENGVNKFEVAGNSLVQDSSVDHYIGEFHNEDLEMPEEVDESYRFFGMVNEVDEMMVDYIAESTDSESGTAVLRKSPNDIAYRLDDRGFDVVKANLQGPEERFRNGLPEDEYFALSIHRTPK